MIRHPHRAEFLSEMHRASPQHECLLDATIGFRVASEHLQPRAGTHYVMREGQDDPSCIRVVGRFITSTVPENPTNSGAIGCVERDPCAESSGVKGIGQQRIDRAFIEGFSTARKAAFRLPLFVQPTTLVDVLDDREQGPEYLAGFRQEALGDRLLREYFIIQFLMVRRSNERSQEATCV